MPDGNTILEIAVPSPLFRSFDYRAPVGAQPARLVPGIRVRVPFGRREVVGILLATKAHTAVAPEKLKQAREILDPEPVFNARMLSLLLWATNYYQHPVGEVFSAALPALLRKPGRPAIAHEQVWTLTPAGSRQLPQELSRAPRQAGVLARLQATPELCLPRETLAVPYSVLRTMQEKGWIRCQTRPASTTPAPTGGGTAGHPALTPAQTQAVQAIHAASNRFEAFLLDGVTGSGKTEVYLQAMQPVLDKGRQVLILVPEIGLTPQLVKRLQTRFRIELSILHSGLTDAQRLHAWQRVAQGQAGIVLGTRSAIFTPLQNPGLIVVDEEHDTSFKQQEGFRYSARDLAVWRARQLKVPVLLGSATPSLESLYNVQQGRYRHLSLPERAGQALAPKMRLLDLRGQPMRDLLSTPLTQVMLTHLQADGQVLLFLNRRGFSPVLLCHACGWVAECHRCDARMTLHQHSAELRCHHCGNQRPVDRYCPACGSSELVAVGEGTERIEQALLEQFPEYPVLRIDRDTTRRKGQLADALASARKGDARILLGTQMLAKGHHFPDVTLAAILETDQGLFSSDFRASERLAQLIIQVGGRAGRAQKAGEVLIQTHHPDHPLLQQLVEKGYAAFAESALQERKAAQLPPYTSLALLRAEATKADGPQNFLQAVRDLATPGLDTGIQIWGPVSAPMERRAGRYRAQLMLHSTRRWQLHKLLNTLLPSLEKEKTARQVRWSIDIDPVDLF